MNNMDTTRVGHTVTAIINGKRQQWTIVERGQSDIEHGKISTEAPLARCLLSLSEGEEDVMTIRGRDMSVKIEEVS